MIEPVLDRPDGELRRALSGANLSRRRRVRNQVATVLMGVSFLVVALPLVVMGVNVVSKGAAVVLTSAWWTEPIPSDVGRADLAGNKDKADLGFGDPADDGADSSITLGMQPAIVGTLLTVAAGSAMAIPLGILGAVYLNEFGRDRRLARLIRFMTDVMVGVPSVVMGVFVYSIWVLRFGTDGKSAFAASLALACLMLPIVVRSTEEMLRLVPSSLREASAALGTRDARTTVRVVLPAALPGITSGALLAVARAAGETAPVVFTIGIVFRTNPHFSGQNTTLSAQIFSQLQNGGSLATQLAWGAAVTLIGIVLTLTVLSRIVARRVAVR